jgi:hypothetical protein
MKMFEAHLTRQVEEECFIKVAAKDADEAVEKAMDIAGEVADLVWRRSNTEPHTVSVEDIKDLAEQENL